MLQYEAEYQRPVVSDGDITEGGQYGYIKVSNLPDDVEDIDWPDWLKCQLAAIINTMTTNPALMCDDGGKLVTFHDYMMVLNSKWRIKIGEAAGRLSANIGSLN